MTKAQIEELKKIRNDLAELYSKVGTLIDKVGKIIIENEQKD